MSSCARLSEALARMFEHGKDSCTLCRYPYEANDESEVDPDFGTSLLRTRHCLFVYRFQLDFAVLICDVVSTFANP